jgi:hypothetical protein
VLTWLVLPFFQVYADAGDFTVAGRCLTSLKARARGGDPGRAGPPPARRRARGAAPAPSRSDALAAGKNGSLRPPPPPAQENGILYGAAAAAGVVGVALLLVVERTLRVADLAALGMGLSNTFALSVGLLLMGFGLVGIPREAWNSGPEERLKWLAHRRARRRGARRRRRP